MPLNSRSNRRPEPSDVSPLAAQALLAAIVDSSDDAIISITLDGRISSWNRSACRIFGFTEAEALGQPIAILYPPDRVEQEEKHLARLLRGERIEHYQTVRRRKDGCQIDISITMSPVLDSSGEIVGYSKVAQDISVRKAAELALRESEERFRSIADNAPVALYIKDLEGRYTFANRLASESLGCSEGVIGRRDHDFLPAAVADRLRERDQEVVASRQPVESEEVVEREGYHADFLSVKFPLVSSTGEVVGVCGVSSEITQRKEAQEALRESEERFTRFMQHLPGLAWIKDSEGRYVYANEAAVQAFQVEPAALYGKTDTDLFPSETAKQFQHNDRAALACGSGVQAIETLKQGDGVVHHSLVNKFPIPGADGRSTLVGGMAIDISDLKEAEAALHQSEDRFRTLASRAPVGIFMSNTTGETVFVNERWRQMAGLTEEQALGQGWAEAIHPEDRDRVLRQWTSAVETGESSEADFRFIRADGTIIWLQGNAVPLRTAAGERIGYIGTIADITERRRAEETIRSLAEASVILSRTLDYEATLEAIARLLVPTFGDWCAVELLGDDHKIQHVTVTHADPRKVDLALELRSRFPPLLDSGQPGVARAIRTGRTEVFADLSDEALREACRSEEQYRLLRRLGMKSAIVVPLIAREKMLGAITVVASESRRCYSAGEISTVQELALRCALAVDNAKLYDDARRELAERRRAEESLLEAHQLAESANRSKSAFLANMSHEIRTPMSAIMGYAELLGRHLSDAEQLRYVEIIRRNGGFLLEILNDVLDLSRIEAGRLEIEKQRIAPHEIFYEVCSLMQVRADEKNLPLVLEFDGRVPESIQSDPTRLRQIVINLVSNAIKFTERGSVRIIVRHDAGVPLLRFDVVDTGIGVMADQVDRLFEPFTQADTSVTRRYGGSGVGLAICKRLVEMLGGWIEVQSEPDQGSTFSVAISTGPLDNVPLVDPQPRASSESSNGDAERDAFNCRVLVVDDQPEVRYLVQNAIKEMGGEAVLATNGHEALEALEHAARSGRAIQVVIMDMQMPVMDGYQAASRLRKIGCQTPIIAVTAHAMQGDRERCLEVGCDEYVTKPIDFRKLLTLVRRFASGQRERQSENGETSHRSVQTTIRHRGCRVLLVEDDKQVCRLMCLQLETHGYEVRCATTGIEAIATVGDFHPQAVVLDLGLPDMSGTEVVTRIKSLPQEEPPICIALSGRNEPEDLERAFAAGFDHYLVKPASLEQLDVLLSAPQNSSA